MTPEQRKELEDNIFLLEVPKLYSKEQLVKENLHLWVSKGAQEAFANQEVLWLLPSLCYFSWEFMLKTLPGVPADMKEPPPSTYVGVFRTDGLSTTLCLDCLSKNLVYVPFNVVDGKIVEL